MTLNLRGNLIGFDEPKVMAIVNVTPDSFYAGSRSQSDREIEQQILKAATQGADFIDFGGYSSRPGASEVDEKEEFRRLSSALGIWRATVPEIPASIDTFRASVARRCVEEWGADIINDISGGTLDPEMWPTVAKLRVPYVLMHMRGTPSTMQSLCRYEDVTAEVIADLAKKVYELRGLGVNDIIIDPGFGFAKTIGQNFTLLRELSEFRKMGMPVLAGVSRKSMIWKTLGTTPADSLEGTIALGGFALANGADILRVHDVLPAKQTATLFKQMKTC